MARDRDDQDGTGRRVGILVVLLALLFAAGLFLWRSPGPTNAPSPGATATQSPPRQTASAPPSAPAPACSAPRPGAAGVFEVHFDFDKSDIRDEDLHWLTDAANAYSELAHELAECSAAGASVIARLDVIGHADSAGPRDYNQSLSERRAAEVTRQLTRRGVPEGAIKASGVGEDDLAVPTPDNTPNPENRRAAVKIVIEAVAPNS
jgi:outer membrane protein OmpA-like peptidoglycan-associated protein